MVFKNKTAEGRLNLCGEPIQQLRRAAGWSQRELADRLQLGGIDLGKNAIQQIESGQRFVTDIELRALAQIFDVKADWLLGPLGQKE